MKIKCISLFGKLMGFVLTMLGFATGCGGKSEYGMPWATYKVSGKVYGSDTQAPVKAIKTILITPEYQNDTVDANYYPTVMTDEEGHFSFEQGMFPLHNDESLELLIRDVDGPENGQYNDTTIRISFKNNPPTGGSGHWDMGSASTDLGTIKLTPKP